MGHGEHWTIHEIAAYLNIRVGSVNSKLARAGVRPVDSSRNERGAKINLYSAVRIRETWPDPSPDERRGGARTGSSLEARARQRADEFEQAGQQQTADDLRAAVEHLAASWKGSVRHTALSEDFEVVAEQAGAAADIIREERPKE